MARELNLGFAFRAPSGKTSYCSIGYDTVEADKYSTQERTGRSLLFIAIVGKHESGDVRELVHDELKEGETLIGLPTSQFSLMSDKMLCSTDQS